MCVLEQYTFCIMRCSGLDQNGLQYQASNGRRTNVGQPPLNLFHTVNQRLIALGMPSFSIGHVSIEPIMYVGLLLAGLLFGLPGLAITSVVFYILMNHGNGSGISFWAPGRASSRRDVGNNFRPINKSSGRRLGGS